MIPAGIRADSLTLSTSAQSFIDFLVDEDEVRVFCLHCLGSQYLADLVLESLKIFAGIKIINISNTESYTTIAITDSS